MRPPVPRMPLAPPLATALLLLLHGTRTLALRAFPRNGTEIPDEKMPPYTHLNEFRDVCVTPHPGTEDHLLTIVNISDAAYLKYLRLQPHCRSLEPNWNDDGLNCGMANFRQAYADRKEMNDMPWVLEPTVAMAFPVTNPGHFVTDVLWSLYPRFHVPDPFSQMWLPDDLSCTSWMCDKLLAYFHMKNQQSMTVLKEQSTTCFRTLYIPQLTRWRWQQDFVPSLEVSLLLRQHLTQAFQAPRKGTVLFYNHEDGHGRVWETAGDAQRYWEEKHYNVHLIRNFSNLSFTEQCQEFWDARFIFTPHGGHLGNLLCAGSNTTIVEMGCRRNVGWFTSAFKLQALMGWDYGYEQVPQSYCLHENPNDFMDSWKWPAEDMARMFDKWRMRPTSRRRPVR